MPTYLVEVEFDARVSGVVKVKAKNREAAEEIGLTSPLRFGRIELIDEYNNNNPREVSGVTKFSSPPGPRRRKRGAIFTPAPPNQFCGNCGLNEVFHPSKPHGDRIACDSFTQPKARAILRNVKELDSAPTIHSQAD
jgi:hypothetical protein